MPSLYPTDVGFYLVVKQEYRNGSRVGKSQVRIAKMKPSLSPHEVAVWINLTLPASLFTRPELRASIVVPDHDAPFIITPEVEQNIARVVEEHTGIVLRVAGAE